MNARHFAVLLAALAVAASSSGSQAPGAQTDAVAEASARARRVERWTELLELDFVRELLAESAAACAPDGPAARDGEALALRARALFAAGREREAEKLLERPVDSARGTAVLRLARARFALERDELAAAIALLAPPPKVGEPVRDPVRDPDLPESWLLLGRALARSGAGKRAAPLFERFLELAPRHVDAPGAWHALAQIALEARDLERAARMREAAKKSSEWQTYYRTRRLQVREQPGEPLPRLGLAELWIAAGDTERAAGVLVELTALCPDFARGWCRRGDVERARGERAAAGTSVARALALEPAFPEARHLRARLAQDAGDLAAARADLEWLVEQPVASEGNHLVAHLELARVLLAQGDRASAEARHARYKELGGREPLEPDRPR